MAPKKEKWKCPFFQGNRQEEPQALVYQLVFIQMLNVHGNLSFSVDKADNHVPYDCAKLI